ncbi:acyltransferase [Luminiphilus sp.]|nr:acyltransferase [Luminiphilus sp.]
MKYRAEIDGLRALAVLPVILFHAGFNGFHGGYVGVDIFFVISGYLITSIILSELELNKFTLTKFYERRARRILPALFLTMILCIAPAFILLLPDPLENFGQSMVATTLFSNNVLLFLTAGYWDLSSEYKPLLHTWSLAVEEQYYLIFPLLMILLWKMQESAIGFVLFGLALMSLWFALGEDNENLSFYSLHTRGFEILCGALICEKFIGRKFFLNGAINEFMSLLGFTLLIYSIVFFSEETPFPSLYTLIPVAGTCFIICFTDQNTSLYRLLANRYVCYVGLLSYSAYLFHQPIFSFLRASTREAPSNIYMSVAVIFIFLLAALSFNLIERPFRQRDLISTPRFAVLISGIGVFLIALGLLIHVTNGFSGRLYPNGNMLEKSKNISARAWQYTDTRFTAQKRRNVLVIGNSFARDAINVLVETYDLSVYNIRYSPSLSDCSLLEDANRDLLDNSGLILFASNYGDQTCINALTDRIADDQELFFLGDKHFGYNLNWILRVNQDDRSFLRNPVTAELVMNEQRLKNLVPDQRYISLIAPLIGKEGILITDEGGRLITDDRRHLTLSGARFIGKTVIIESKIDDFFHIGERVITE